MKVKIHDKHKNNIKLNISKYSEAVNLYQIEELANSTFNTNTYSYYSTGSMNMNAMYNNENDFNKIQLIPKILVPVGNIDTKTTLINDLTIDFPLCISPTAMHKLCHPDGEIETAKASTQLNTLMCLSTICSISLTKIAPYAKNKWMQLYILKDLKKCEKMINMIEKSGYTGLVITVDTPVAGIRDIENIYKFTGDNNIQSVKTDKQNETNIVKVESKLGQYLNTFFNEVNYNILSILLIF